MKYIRYIIVIIGIFSFIKTSLARVFDDESVCNGAVVLSADDIITWTTDNRFVEYVKEAKRRGLDCGVIKNDFKLANNKTLKIPKNSTFLGKDWYCDAGYKKINNKCENIFKDFPNKRKPENSIVFGAGWQCKVGFRKENKRCIANFVSSNDCMQNGMLLKTSNGSLTCKCKIGYSMSGGKCIKGLPDYMKNKSDRQICKNTDGNRTLKKKIRWTEYWTNQYVYEAKRRGLECVDNFIASVIKMDDESICNFAITNTGAYEKNSSYLPFVNEAKRRGLKCKLNEIKTASIKKK